MRSKYGEWDMIYRKYPLDTLGWELGRPRPILVEYIENCAIPRGRVLDLCCGAGTNTVYLAEKGFDVVGIDVSPTAIEYAQAQARQAHVNIDFIVESFLELTFKASIFDFIFDMGCFHHVEPEDRDKFLSDVCRVLKTGGLYMLTSFSSQNGLAWNHFTEQQLKEFFEEFFAFKAIRHYPSIEGDGYTRYFFTVLMKKK